MCLPSLCLSNSAAFRWAAAHKPAIGILALSLEGRASQDSPIPVSNALLVPFRLFRQMSWLRWASTVLIFEAAGLPTQLERCWAASILS